MIQKFFEKPYNKNNNNDALFYGLEDERIS